ncbi:allurin-like [Hyperolius riggenbachi]|uniref:allurin-like n=1 Tax=Hyperolius riggenbachi TaxID=752182 RepID=UPI0035A395E3
MLATNILYLTICLHFTIALANWARKPSFKKSSESSESSEEEDKVNCWIKANQDEIVNLHNLERSKVKPEASDMRKVSWCKDAARNAQRVANECSDDHSHPGKRYIKKPIFENCGENYYFSSVKVTWDCPLRSWCKEKDDFIYGEGPRGGAITGHYTQVVWSDSYLIGCAYAECENLDYPHFYVCHYCPAGNSGTKDKKPYAKGKSCSKCKGRCENKLCV